MKPAHLLMIIPITCSLAACGGKPANWKNVSSATPMDQKNTRKQPETGGFMKNLPDGFEMPTDDAGERLLREYGAVFLARGGAVPPKIVVFRDAAQVAQFQSSAPSSKEIIGGVTIELQTPAMDALKQAIAEGASSGTKITPRGSDAAKRSYDDTVTLWKSRVDPALDHWRSVGRLQQAEADRIRSLSPYQQVPEVLRLESEGMFFSKDLSKSIIYSVAPPGTSQHLSMLALDVAEFDNAATRALLAKHGWYQTVVSDLPHFTYLGVPEAELSSLGLKRVVNDGRTFWVPDI